MITGAFRNAARSLGRSVPRGLVHVGMISGWASRRLLWRCLLIGLCVLLSSAIGTAAAADLPAVKRQWTIDGVQREALVCVPDHANSTPTAVVFVFHGHGGSMQNSLRTFQYNKHWPQAISVYLQGLNTPGRLTDPDGKKPGWQKEAGDQGDRDLKFFDAVLTTLKTEFKVDDNRIYSTGHSNGGGFTYLLWAERGDLFAAMAPSGSAAIRCQPKLRAKPVFHVAGANDPLVKFAWQKQTIDYVLKMNDCDQGRAEGDFIRLYKSESGNPVVTYITKQGHKFPKESVPHVVK